MLRRALRNLLENARRYGGDQISACVWASTDGAVRLQVCDRGPGVPADLRERIFEPYFRLPGHAEREGGVGLGLSLVRQIAQAHGGSVHCLAREGGGSCFVINLPPTKLPRRSPLRPDQVQGQGQAGVDRPEPSACDEAFCLASTHISRPASAKAAKVSPAVEATQKPRAPCQASGARSPKPKARP